MDAGRIGDLHDQPDIEVFLRAGARGRLVGKGILTYGEHCPVGCECCSFADIKSALRGGYDRLHHDPACVVRVSVNPIRSCTPHLVHQGEFVARRFVVSAVRIAHGELRNLDRCLRRYGGRKLGTTSRCDFHIEHVSPLAWIDGYNFTGLQAACYHRDRTGHSEVDLDGIEHGANVLVFLDVRVQERKVFGAHLG